MLTALFCVQYKVLSFPIWFKTKSQYSNYTLEVHQTKSALPHYKSVWRRLVILRRPQDAEGSQPQPLPPN